MVAAGRAIIDHEGLAALTMLAVAEAGGWMGDVIEILALQAGEDEALQQNPKFWEMIESAKSAARE